MVLESSEAQMPDSVLGTDEHCSDHVAVTV